MRWIAQTFCRAVLLKQPEKLNTAYWRATRKLRKTIQQDSKKPMPDRTGFKKVDYAQWYGAYSTVERLANALHIAHQQDVESAPINATAEIKKTSAGAKP